MGLLLQGTEVITIWLWLTFGSFVWLCHTHAGILEVQAQSSFRRLWLNHSMRPWEFCNHANKAQARPFKKNICSCFCRQLWAFYWMKSHFQRITVSKTFSLLASVPFFSDWKRCVKILLTDVPLFKPAVVPIFNRIINWMRDTIMQVNTPVSPCKKLKKISRQVASVSHWDFGNECLKVEEDLRQHDPRWYSSSRSVRQRNSSETVQSGFPGPCL